MKTTIRKNGATLGNWAVVLACMILCILASNRVNAQDIDLTQPCNNTSATIYAPLGSALAVNIGATNAPAGNLAWTFAAAPTGFGGVTCSGTNPVDCNGVIITLPAPASGSQVMLTGTPSSGAGGFSMTLEAAVGVTGCTRDYFVDFVEPFQTVLVLDRSGSMGSSTHTSAPATDRWNAVEFSVNGFSPHFVNSGEVSGSDLGITLFNGDIIANNSFTNGLETITNNLPTQIDNELSSQSPGGSTAMGKGVENAITKFTDPANPRAILLFTDGEQNVPPFVDLNGQFLNTNARSGCAAAGPNCTEISTDINIVTIGIGQPSGDYLTTLMNLAAEHNGYSLITSNGSDFDFANGASLGNVEDAFTNAIAPVLSSNSPQMVSFAKGELVGTNPVSLPDFNLNKRLGRLVLQFSYSSRFELPQLFTLLAGIRIEKDGNDITAYFSPTIVGNFSNSITLTTDFTAPGESSLSDIDSEGSYSVTMVKSSDIKDITFKAVAFADDHALDMAWQVEPKTPRVSQDLQPQMDLSWLGTPLDGAAVSAFVLKPGDDLGDLLANYGASIDPSSATDAGTAGYQKYLHLLENDPAFLEKLLPSEQQLTLNHQGNGLYSAGYNPGEISGVYQILYDVRFDSPESGQIQRLAAQSVYVRFGELDTAASDIATSIRGTTTTITMKPISNVGKFIGPGQQHAFAFTGKNLSVANVTDHQDGRYTFVLEGDPDQNIDITLLGETIYNGPFDKFAEDGNGSPGLQWLWWLLGIIILIIVIWLLRKMLSS
jgi:hypothetical protein